MCRERSHIVDRYVGPETPSTGKVLREKHIEKGRKQPPAACGGCDVDIDKPQTVLWHVQTISVLIEKSFPTGAYPSRSQSSAMLRQAEKAQSPREPSCYLALELLWRMRPPKCVVEPPEGDVICRVFDDLPSRVIF